MEPGERDLTIYTGAVPRESERLSVKEPERELRRLTLPRRRGHA